MAYSPRVESVYITNWYILWLLTHRRRLIAAIQCGDAEVDHFWLWHIGSFEWYGMGSSRVNGAISCDLHLFCMTTLWSFGGGWFQDCWHVTSPPPFLFACVTLVFRISISLNMITIPHIWTLPERRTQKLSVRQNYDEFTLPNPPNTELSSFVMSKLNRSTFNNCLKYLHSNCRRKANPSLHSGYLMAMKNSDKDVKIFRNESNEEVRG